MEQTDVLTANSDWMINSIHFPAAAPAMMDAATLPPLPTLRALDLHQVARALQRLGRLTERQYCVLVELLRGVGNEEIARATNLSRRVVKFHVSNILRKLRIQQREELLRFMF